MHVIICGGRWFNDRDAIADYLAYLHDRYGEDLTIITGGAPGADSIAAALADTMGIDHDEYPAKWDECGPECPPVHMKRNSRGSLYCPTAGHRRNQQMLDALPRAANGSGQRLGGVACFIDRPLEKSTGTKNMHDIAKEADVPVRVIFAKQLRDDVSSASSETRAAAESGARG